MARSLQLCTDAHMSQILTVVSAMLPERPRDCVCTSCRAPRAGWRVDVNRIVVLRLFNGAGGRHVHALRLCVYCTVVLENLLALLADQCTHMVEICDISNPVRVAAMLAGDEE
jgi:hypothetical protein